LDPIECVFLFQYNNVVIENLLQTFTSAKFSKSTERMNVVQFACHRVDSGESAKLEVGERYIQFWTP